jgi:hypothetical protein
MSMPNIPNITPIIDIDREDAFNIDKIEHHDVMT